MPRSEPSRGNPDARDRRGACGNVSMMGAGLRPSGKPLDQPPYPKMQSAPHFYPDRIGPEPCADVREGAGEASVGECIGQPSSGESPFVPGADTVELAEGNTQGRDSASALVTRRGRRPWHVQTLLVTGN